MNFEQLVKETNMHTKKVNFWDENVAEYPSQR